MPLLTKRKVESKAEFARARMKETALHLGPGGKLPTVRELRRLLGVGTPTIMDALWDLEKAGVIDRKHGSGLYVSQRIHQKTIGLLFSRFAFLTGGTPFYSMLIQLCEQRAKSRNEQFTFYINVPEQGAKNESLLTYRNFVEDVNQGKLQGVLRTYEMSAAEQTWLREKNVPVVGFVPAVHDATEMVDVDWAELVRLGVEALAAQGCRRIGLLTIFGFARHLHRPFEEDRRAYRETLDRLGMEFRPEWICEQRMESWPAEVPESFGQWEELGHAMMKSLFEGKESGAELPDGFVVTDDGMARGALIAARQLGLVVGQDIRIATQANKGSPFLKLCVEPMTLMEVDPTEIVEAMFVMLERLMEGGQPPSQAVLIKPRLAEHRGLRILGRTIKKGKNKEGTS